MDIYVLLIVDCSGSMGGVMPILNENLRDMYQMMENDKANTYHLRAVEVGGRGMAKHRPRVTNVFSPEGMAKHTFVSDGGTPLFDAIGVAFNNSNDPAGMGHRAVCFLITDGGEAGSVRYSWEETRDFIRDKVFTGWKFAYMAIGYSAAEQAREVERAIKAENKQAQMFWKDITEPTYNDWRVNSKKFMGDVVKFMKG